MNQKIKLSQGIQYVIIGLAILLFAMIWPLGIIDKTQVSKSEEIQLQESGPISVANNGTQMFIAEGSNLKAVDLYILNDMRSQTITFRVYDGAYQQLWETFYVVDEKAQFPGFVRINIDMEMEEGWEYYYTVEGLTADLYLAYEDTYESTSYANGTLLYGGEEMPGMNIIVRYIYNEPFSWWMTLIFAVVIFALAKAACMLVDKIFTGRNSEKNKEITVQKLIQWIANPVIVITTLIALLAVFPGRVFGTGIINYGFYYIGITLTAVVLLFGVNYKRVGNEPLITVEIMKERLPQWAMAICFAKVLWSCYEYMNGLYTIHHTLATCKILIWFGLAFCCTLKKDELLKIWNLIYLAAAGIGGYFYAKPYFGIEGEEELYKLQAYVMIVGGFVFLQIIVSLIQLFLKKRKPNGVWLFPYAGCFVAVITLMIIFRNTRNWPILAAVMFGCFYYRMWLWEKRDKLLLIFSNGILLNFLYMVLFCLVHRPYLRFKFNRYGMGFHTVTMTGYYLALVLCAVLVRLFVKYYKTGRWQDIWKELSLLGIGNVYLFLTLSRTGYLAACVMEIFICIFMVVVWEQKQKLPGVLKKLGAGIAISVMFFPIVFTAQRIMPAVCNDPIYSEIEIWDYVVEKGDRKDSELYIDITAFIKVAGYKLFDIDMGNISLSSIESRTGIHAEASEQTVTGTYAASEWKTTGDIEEDNIMELMSVLTEEITPVSVANDSMLVASEAELYEEANDISNGRFEIFKEYISQWNLTGHEKMAFQFPNGTTPAHAHNSFLQMIHDHGLITGILFLIFGIFTFILSTWRYTRSVTENTLKLSNGDEESSYQVLTIAVVIAFAAAAMVEWIFHISNPFGFSIFIVIVPLLFKEKVQGR